MLVEAGDAVVGDEARPGPLLSNFIAPIWVRKYIYSHYVAVDMDESCRLYSTQYKVWILYTGSADVGCSKGCCNLGVRYEA